MTVKFSVITRPNPYNPGAAARYYPSAKSSGRCDLRKLAQRVSEMSTLTTIDILAVTEALLHIIPQELADGNIVELGDFGSYHLTLRGEGAAESEDINSHSIRQAKAHFLPGKLFKKVLSTIDYEKESGERAPAAG
jgi:predicted histone-like DNA-binding protein